MNIWNGIDENVDKKKIFMLSIAYLCSDKDLMIQYRFSRWKWDKSTYYNAIKERLKFLKIQNPEDLKSRANWFLNTGFRKDFNQMIYFLKGLLPKDRKDYIDSLSKNDERYKKLFIADYYMNRLPLSTVTAYDYAWYCCLYFAGNEFGYIKDCDLWEIVRKAVVHIQRSYSDWEEYVTAYLAGAQFHTLDTEFNFIKNNSKFFERYFLDPKSPVNKIEWNIEL